MSSSSYSHHSIYTPLLVVLGSVLFCSKGFIVKYLYAEGLNTSEVLTLRMLTAFPFFLIMAISAGRKITSIQKKDWAAMAGLSFVGYFLCSLINFTGLQFVSVGLERILLFSYPSIVLLGSVIFQKKRHSTLLYFACALTWAGLVMIIREEIHFAGNVRDILWGSTLILMSAIIYAGYIIIAKPVIQRVGVKEYTGISMSFSSIFVFGYFALSNGKAQQLFSSPAVLGYGAFIGVFCTVAPILLLSYGLSKVSSSSYAVISSIGPVITIIAAMLFVGSLPTIAELLGVTLAISGGFIAATQKESTATKS